MFWLILAGASSFIVGALMLCVLVWWCRKFDEVTKEE